MSKIYCVGEAVYDIIFKNDKPVEGRPGGAMLNTAVSLGRLGLPVSFIGDFADDHVGQMSCDFLKENGVDTNWVTFYPGARSRIALAFLDDDNNAHYSFYKIGVEKPEIRFPEAVAGDIILFGSWFGIKPEIREAVFNFLTQAKDAGALIINDPNFRRAHLGMLPKVKGFLEENIRIAHITKGSDEDFHFILNTSDVSRVHKYTLKLGCAHFIYTANRNGVWLFEKNMSKNYPAMKIKPVSTVGAGDSFNAGLVYSLAKKKINPANLSSLCEKDWDEIIETSIQFASGVCMSFDNYISVDFANLINSQTLWNP
jgi:fructokinase